MFAIFPRIMCSTVLLRLFNFCSVADRCYRFRYSAILLIHVSRLFARIIYHSYEGMFSGTPIAIHAFTHSYKMHGTKWEIWRKDLKYESALFLRIAWQIGFFFFFFVHISNQASSAVALRFGSNIQILR